MTHYVRTYDIETDTEEWIGPLSARPDRAAANAEYDAAVGECDALMDDGETEHACLLTPDHDDDHECDCGATW